MPSPTRYFYVERYDQTYYVALMNWATQQAIGTPRKFYSLETALKAIQIHNRRAGTAYLTRTNI